MNELLDLAATWDRLSGQRLAEANRFGPTKAGEIRATEAGVLRDCAADLRKAVAAATVWNCPACGQRDLAYAHECTADAR